MQIPLASFTTLRVGGTAREIVEPETTHELIHTVAMADSFDDPVLILGGGSNVVISDDGFDGTVVRIRTNEVSSSRDGDVVRVRAEAGVPWDTFVARTVTDGWSGLECLSGIPGSVGATPIQNVGAYGHEVAEFIESVEVFDRENHSQFTMTADDCEFGYRSSVFKSNPGRYLVLAVNFVLAADKGSAPIKYAELASALGVAIDESAPSELVRRTVWNLRQSKGMVLDIDDHDTWSVGSFFTNPIVDLEVVAQLPDDAPRWEQPDGRAKLSAAWLISYSGFDKGWPGDPNAKASLSTKHALAITNRGEATAVDVLDVARDVQAGVAAKTGITLEPEARLINCSL
ncbi:MAG: UDP-N-acetylmuramate dehydrogenase [Candidatus Nanopelagicales bacterium]